MIIIFLFLSHVQLESVISAHVTETDTLKQRIVSLEEKSKQDLLDLQNEHRLKVELVSHRTGGITARNQLPSLVVGRIKFAS